MELSHAAESCHMAFHVKSQYFSRTVEDGSLLLVLSTFLTNVETIYSTIHKQRRFSSMTKLIEYIISIIQVPAMQHERMHSVHSRR